MKKTLYTTAITLAFVYFINYPALADSIRSPHQAVDEIMVSIIYWDVRASSNISEEGLPDDYAAAIFENVVPAVLSRLEYDIGSSKITGNTAVVDISVTAANIKEAAGEIISQAVGCAAIQRLLGLPIDVNDFVTSQIAKALDDETLTTIKTDTSVYLILGGDGEWKLDMAQPKNLRFIEAVSGGIVDFDEAINVLAG